MHEHRDTELTAIASPAEGEATPGHHAPGRQVPGRQVPGRQAPGLFGHKIERDAALAEMEAVRELLDVEIGMQRMIQHLQVEVGRLQRPDREIFEMRHIHHLSFEQIARQTGLPSSAVKDRCFQSIDKIRMRMKRRHSRA